MELSLIATRLEGLEETIIWKLIDRAQFCQNLVIYEPGHSGFEGERFKSLFEIRMRSQEEIDARFGRFCVPEERPFNRPDLPPAQRKVQLENTEIPLADFDVINVTRQIKDAYLSLLPMLCVQGDDGQYGSSVENDVFALQAIARRIHFGAMYIAESKFRSDPQQVARFVDSNDSEGILQWLTRPEVENMVLNRVQEKVLSAQAKANLQVRHLIKPDIVVDFYKNSIIPLTKQGEVLYFFNRIKQR